MAAIGTDLVLWNFSWRQSSKITTFKKCTILRYTRFSQKFQNGTKVQLKVVNHVCCIVREKKGITYLHVRFRFSVIVFHEKTACSVVVHYVAVQCAKLFCGVLVIFYFYFLSICLRNRNKSQCYKRKKQNKTK